MKDTCYLTFDRRGICKMSKGQPKLGQGEFATKVVIDCDDRFFKQIIPETTIKIGADFLITPEVTVTPEAAPRVGGENSKPSGSRPTPPPAPPEPKRK